MEEAFFAVLEAAVGFPIAWGVQPATQDAFPYANLTLVSSIDLGTLDDDEDEPAEAIVQVDTWGRTIDEAVLASREVKAALDAFDGVVGEVMLQILFDGARSIEGGSIPIGGRSVTLHGRSADYRVTVT